MVGLVCCANEMGDAVLLKQLDVRVHRHILKTEGCDPVSAKKMDVGYFWTDDKMNVWLIYSRDK